MVVQGLERNGVVLRFCEDGRRDAGSTLVFSNSLGTDMRIWMDVARVFQETMRVVRYDKRGHGMSDAPDAPYTLEDHVDDLDAILEHLKVDNAIVVGVSVGGMIAQGLALKSPHRVRGLVLCDTAAKIGTSEAWDERIAAIRGRWAGVNRRRHYGAVVFRWFSGRMPGRTQALEQPPRANTC